MPLSLCSLSEAGEAAAAATAAGGKRSICIVQPCTRAGAQRGEVTHDPLSTGGTYELIHFASHCVL